MPPNSMKISLVTPMYNEEEVIAGSVRKLVAALRELGDGNELVLVNDGSTDGSYRIAAGLQSEYPELTVVGYKVNRGRGHAMRTGFAHATGRIIVTTESDSTWGDDIVQRLVRALSGDDEADMVIASPHLKGGGYSNVPRYRVALSAWGNIFLTWVFGGRVSMTTGMTRCYKREVLDSMALECDGKEIHLEILSKALILGYRVKEIPATIAWKPGRNKKGIRSKLKLLPLAWKHLEYGFNEKPATLIGTAGLVSLALGTVALVVNIVHRTMFRFSAADGEFKSFPSPVLITLLVLLGAILLVFSFIATQNRRNYAEMIKLQALLLRRNEAPGHGGRQ